MSKQKLTYHKALKRATQLDPTERKNINTNPETFWARIYYNQDITHTNN